MSYGFVAYLAFLGTILYAIGFTGNMFVSKSLDSTPNVSLANAILINCSLLLLFALQHSLMARKSFKRIWIKFIPEPIERSTYVLLASGCLSLTMWQWQPMGGVLWTVESESGKGLVLFLFFLGWSLVFFSTFLINHFDLFGIRQVWLYFKGRRYEQLQFSTPNLYRMVRHPLYFGFLVAFWCTPVMTVAHLLFAVLCTGYILTAIQFEEKDLLAQFGDRYNLYRTQAPMIIPFLKKKA